MTESHRNALPVGHRLHEYRIEQILGAGGFGVTYLAYDENLQQSVAIKEYMPNDLAVREGTTVHPKSSGDEETFRWGLDRFIQEARNLARFRHPNIVQVLRFFEANNTAYMVMPFEDGDSLKNILARRKSRLDEEALKAILLPLLDGLEDVHGSGMIHRDIAPDNIYIRRKDESPVLLDFGAARQAVGGKSKSLSVVVKDGYAPAEQYETHGNQGPWTDIYALGAVVYRAIFGEAPAESPARSNALLRRKPDPLQPAVEVGRGQYSEPFLLAVDHALAVIETDRPQSVVDWRGEMIGAHYPAPTLSPKSPPAPKTPPPEPESSSPAGGRKIFWIVGGLLLLAGGGYFAEQVRETARQEEIRQAREMRRADEARQAQAEAERQAQAKAEAERQAQAKLEAERQAQAKIEFVRVAGGTFEIGCGSWQSNCDDDEKPSHTVTVGSFEIGKYEVTQKQWRAVMGVDPPELKFVGCDDCPVEGVSWNDVQEFIRKLNAQGQGKYRLPTEAEWEYACRSGGKPEKYCGGNDIDRLAWYDGNSGRKTHPVGQKAANGLGIYDMSGNVWEWTCSDWGKYDDGGKNHAKCSSGGSYRVKRGGSWNLHPDNVRSADRGSRDPGRRSSYLGFRLTRTIP